MSLKFFITLPLLNKQLLLARDRTRHRGGATRQDRGGPAGAWRLLPGPGGPPGLGGGDGLETRTGGQGWPRPGGGPSQVRSAIASRPHLTSSIGRPGEVHWPGAYSRSGTAVKAQGDRELRQDRPPPFAFRPAFPGPSSTEAPGSPLPASAVQLPVAGPRPAYPPSSSGDA
jgi:hypothetical protein